MRPIDRSGNPLKGYLMGTVPKTNPASNSKAGYHRGAGEIDKRDNAEKIFTMKNEDPQEYIFSARQRLFNPLKKNK